MSKKSKERWWADVEEEDPITLEPLSSLQCPPFEIEIPGESESTRGSRGHLFDGHVLAEYVVSQVCFLQKYA